MRKVKLRVCAAFAACSMLVACDPPGSMSDAAPDQVDGAASDVMHGDSMADVAPDIADATSDATESGSDAADSMSDAADSMSDAADSMSDAADSMSDAADSMSDAADSMSDASDAMIVDSTPAIEAGSGRPASTCSMTPIVVPAGATMTIPVTTTLAPSGVAFPYFACDLGVSPHPSSIAQSARFTLSAPSQVTVYKTHSSIGYAMAFGIATDCASAAPTCIQSTPYPGIISRVLAAGTYEIQSQIVGTLNVIVEPPAPAPTNTTCATAIPLASATLTSIGPRVTDTNSRFLSWRSADRPGISGGYNLRVVSPTTNGSATFVLRAGCGAGAPEAFRWRAGYLIGAHIEPGLVIEGLSPNTNYVLEVSAISIGAQIQVALSP